MTEALALIIEDDEMLAEVCAEAARTAGFEPEIIRDGETALEVLNTVLPVLVILDLHLPRLSGEALLFHIREDERLNETPIIVTSADIALANHLRGHVNHVLEKPLGFRELQTLLCQYYPPK